MTYDLICLGAGLSGVTLAKTVSSKAKVLLIDKARGPGGRMSTRRINLGEKEYRFDHGAQFLTARSKDFQDLIAPYVHSGSVKPWHSSIPHEGFESEKPSERFCGSSGMNQLVKDLASHLDKKFSWHCSEILFEDSVWILKSVTGETLRAKNLALTCPTPQARKLLEKLEISLKPLSKIEYTPCWAVLLASSFPFQLPPPHARWMNKDSGIDWVCDNQKKGISQHPSLSIHLSEKKSIEMLEAEPEQVIEFAKSQCQKFLPQSLLHESAHRWLYSRSKNVAFDPPFLFYDSPGPLVIAGDAFGGGRVEGAALSGLRAGEKLLERL